MKSEDRTWWMTSDLGIAMANNYIGEDVIIPKKSYNSFQELMGRKLIKPIRIFYYGKASDELLDRFGYLNIQQKAIDKIHTIDKAHEVAGNSSLIFKK